MELGPRPILTAHEQSKIAIVGQAPGSVVHKCGVPWDDKSGENLKAWMQMDHSTFYDEKKVALIPMGFCYPGKRKSGDLPPRRECAPQWHESVFSKMSSLQLIILIGKYAQDHYLENNTRKNLTETVMHFEEHLPRYFVLPHPSPRNNIWQARNPWFQELVIPSLRKEIRKIWA